MLESALKDSTQITLELHQMVKDVTEEPIEDLKSHINLSLLV